MHSVGLYPLIVRPTGITTHIATIIDNIFTSLVNDKMISGLIVDDISDHLPIFTIYNTTNVPKSQQPSYV